MISTDKTKNWRQKFMLILMGINIILLFTFIWQSYHASVNHLRASQNVLRDYAHIAGQQFARKLKGNLGYWALHDLRSQVVQANTIPQTSISQYFGKSTKELKAKQIKVREGIQSIHLYNSKDDSLITLHGQELSHFDKKIKPIDFSIIDTFTILHPYKDKGLLTWAFLAINKYEFYVVEFTPNMIYENIVFSFESSDLLPKVLNDKISNSKDIKLSLNVKGNNPIFKNGQYFNPYLSAEITMNDDYGNLFEGYQIRVAFDEKIAEKLIIGGIPSNQIYKLLLLVVLTLFVLLATFITYRKEQKLANLRSQFVARVSHELRTPLTQIRMFSETLLLNRVANDEEKNRYLDIIHRESKHLSYLIDNILNMHENENNKSSVFFEFINVLSELEFVVDNFDSICKDRKIDIQLSVDSDLQLKTDKLKFRQIFLNFVDNAIKYGPLGQTIKITAEKSVGKLIIAVCDQGPGIKKSMHKKIWQPYFRLEREDKKAINGTGIGLAITAENLQRIKATCLIKNNNKQGSCFEVSFPLTKSSIND